jgi:DNA-binding NarL/FixJ family response regulator
MDIIRVLVVDDHGEVRAMVPVVLMADPGIRVVGEARNGHEALHLLSSVEPHVVIMDMIMPDLNGLDATRQIREESSKSKVVMLTTSEDPRDLRASIEAGACGYVLKRLMARDLVTAVRAAVDGMSYVSPAVAAKLSYNPCADVGPYAH